MYPTAAVVNGKRYPINTDYRVALRCFRVINDADIGDYERALAVIYLLFGDVPLEYAGEFIAKAKTFLECGKEQRRGSVDMDFEQDADLISASFLSDYGIDISNADMHWYQYVALISGLTESAALSRVREIRNYDLSDLPDDKSRRRMARAQQDVALKERRTKEEQDALDAFNALFEGV